MIKNICSIICCTNNNNHNNNYNNNDNNNNSNNNDDNNSSDTNDNNNDKYQFLMSLYVTQPVTGNKKTFRDTMKTRWNVLFDSQYIRQPLIVVLLISFKNFYQIYFYFPC